eukprot:124197-Prymnesium_polylepis.1
MAAQRLPDALCLGARQREQCGALQREASAVALGTAARRGRGGRASRHEQHQRRAHYACKARRLPRHCFGAGGPGERSYPHQDVGVVNAGSRESASDRARPRPTESVPPRGPR